MDTDIRRRFETPRSNRIGDCVIFALGAPLCTGATWALMVMLMLAALQPGPAGEEVVLRGTWFPAALTVLWIFRRQFWWSLTLADDGVQLGPKWIGIRIPYDHVRFLRLGSLLERGSHAPSRSVPVRIEAGWMQTHRFMVARVEAEFCLEALRRRCRKAPAVDVLGDPPRDHLPLDPGSHAEGVQRLQRFWALLGALLASMLCAAIAYVLSLLIDETSRQALVARVTERPGALFESIAALIAVAGFAWFCLRQSRNGR